MTDVIEQRLRAAALGTPADPPPLSALRRRAARRRAASGVAGLAAVAAIATGVAVLQPFDRTSASQVARTVTEHGLRVEVRVDDAELEVGDTVTVRFRATNTTDGPLRYVAKNCGLGASMSLDVLLAPTSRTWTGVAAAFEEAVFMGMPATDAGRGLFGEGDAPCTTSPPTVELGPGDAFSGEASTEVTLDGGTSSGAGRVLLSLLLEGTPAEGVKDILVPVPLTVTGASERLGRYEAVDAALADREFAAWLEQQSADDRDRAFIAPVGGGYQPTGWRVGLGAPGAADAMGQVVIDAITGAVVERTLPLPGTPGS